jgi:hypothetical protein
MRAILATREEFVARIPPIVFERNTEKLAEDIERLCLRSSIKLDSEMSEQQLAPTLDCGD